MGALLLGGGGWLVLSSSSREPPPWGGGVPENGLERPPLPANLFLPIPGGKGASGVLLERTLRAEPRWPAPADVFRSPRLA